MPATQLDYVDFVVLRCIVTEYKESGQSPTQEELTGKGNNWNGLINKYITVTSKHRYRIPLRSQSNFNNRINRLRNAGLIIRQRGNGSPTPYEPTDEGIQLIEWFEKDPDKEMVLVLASVKGNYVNIMKTESWSK